MEWEKYKSDKKLNAYIPAWLETDIECPECKANIYVNTKEVLTSYPPKHKYKCERCGWTGTA